MKNILSLIAATCCVGALSAQTTVLTEDFNANVVPPAGWSQLDLNPSAMTMGWVSDLAGQAFHDDEYGQSEKILATPMVDFTGMTEVYVHMDMTTNYVAYMAHSIAEGYGYGNGVTTLEASHDGGATWMVLWTDDILMADNGLAVTRDIDISAHAGHTGMMIGLHFSGDWAHEMWVDSFVIDDQAGGGGGGGLTYAISGLTAGQVADFSVTGAGAGESVMIGYSLRGAGPINTAYGVLDMTPPINILVSMTADANGDAVHNPTVPGNAAGVTLYTQALVNNATLTNSLAEVVQ